MEKIKKVTGDSEDIFVHFANGIIKCDEDEEVFFEGKFNFINKELNNKPKEVFLTYYKFSKPELKELQLILLNAYVFCYDNLDEAIENSASKQDLDKLKETIKGVRLNLRALTKYIDNYDNMMEEYKDI